MPASVKERFRPFLAELLGRALEGATASSRWGPRPSSGSPPMPIPKAFAAFWKRDDRYEATLAVRPRRVPGGEGPAVRKPLTLLLPLPHPSPAEPALVQAVPRRCSRGGWRRSGYRPVEPHSRIDPFRRAGTPLPRPRGRADPRGIKSEKLRVADCQAGELRYGANDDCSR